MRGSASSSSSAPVQFGPSPAPAWTGASCVYDDTLRVLAEEALGQATLGGWREQVPEFPPSQELLDVVGLANQASRHGLGHIVWFSWEGATWGKGRKWIPTEGTNFLAIDREGRASYGRTWSQ